MSLHTRSNPAEVLKQIVTSSEIDENLRLIASEFPGKVVFSSSFSFEDQVISHIIFSERLPISVFTLDTGRLFPETYSTWSKTLERYKIPVKTYNPDAATLQAFLEWNGPNSFYESVENRKACCHIRKVEPLKRALAGNRVWITGIRAEHSPDRSNLQNIEWDGSNSIAKYNPLLNWSSEEVRAFIDKNAIPYNPLHTKGFISIGCAPCTRAVKSGEDFRAGRWWWEDADKKECGLHSHQ